MKVIAGISAVFALVFTFMLLPAASTFPTPSNEMEMNKLQYMPVALTVSGGTTGNLEEYGKRGAFGHQQHRFVRHRIHRTRRELQFYL
ncbi:MAG: hypothetical protein TUN42_00065 [Dehalogenimonas sp.]